MAARVAIIGAGIGGLAAAALLSARGLAVTVIEKAGHPGGKARQLSVDGVGIVAVVRRRASAPQVVLVT